MDLESKVMPRSCGLTCVCPISNQPAEATKVSGMTYISTVMSLACSAVRTAGKLSTEKYWFPVSWT